MENVKFKVGDYVRCVDKEHETSLVKIGKVYKVTKINSPNGVFITGGDLVNAFYLNERFELAEDYILKEIWSN